MFGGEIMTMAKAFTYDSIAQVQRYGIQDYGGRIRDMNYRIGTSQR